jgi:uncharacterized protein YfaS (alpha-2-macroglobulin family)
VNRLRRGTEVYIEVEIRDRTVSPSSLLDPDGGVFFTLKNPSGTTVLNLVAMTKKSAGVYIYRYQTSAGDPLGVWAMEFKAIHGIATHHELEMGAFELVSA